LTLTFKTRENKKIVKKEIGKLRYKGDERHLEQILFQRKYEKKYLTQMSKAESIFIVRCHFPYIQAIKDG